MFASQKRRVSVLTRDKVGALFDVCGLAGRRGQRDRVALGLVLDAGLRGAEAVRLDWTDLERREICGALRTVVHVHGGRRRERQLVVSDWLGVALDEWADDRDRCGQVLRRVLRGGHVGPALTEAGFFKLIARLGLAAGLDDLRPVTLRLTSACVQVRARGLEYASLALGDADAGRTLLSLGSGCEVAEAPVPLLWTEGLPGGP